MCGTTIQSHHEMNLYINDNINGINDIVDINVNIHDINVTNW